MTFDEFQIKYNNQPVEAVDPTNKNQCFDLVVQYCMDVLGLPITIFSGLSYAYQIWIPSTSLAVSKFDYIENTADNVPQKGDIVVWSHWYNWTWRFWGAGHTGIATGNGNANSFECFEQNDPTGTYSHLRWYNYTSIVGWLRLKGPVPLTDQQKVNKITIEVQSGNSDGDKILHIKNILGL